MVMSMKKGLVLLLMVVFYVTSYAQMPNPVHWSFCIKKLSNNEAALIMTANIDKGYHLWSQDPGHADLIPTTFTFKKSEHFELVGKVTEEGKLIKEDLSSIDLGMVRYYEGPVKFIQKIKIKNACKIEFSIECQTCSHKGCLPPRTDDFSINSSEPCKAKLPLKGSPSMSTDLFAGSFQRKVESKMQREIVLTWPKEVAWRSQNRKKTETNGFFA